MAFDPTKISMAVPKYSVDQIIGITSGTVSVAAATSGLGDTIKTATETFDTGFGESCYFQGIFSLDGGTTWNDFGTYIPYLGTPGQPVFQTTTCRGYITSGGVFTAVGINWWNFVTGSSSAYDIDYKVALIAKVDQGPIEPIATNESLYYRSNTNYQKVVDADTFTSSTSSNTTIVHNLSYVPNVRAFFVNDSATVGGDGAYEVPAGAMCTPDWFNNNILIDDTSVTFTPMFDSSSSGVAGTVHYRIYLDS